MSFDFIQESTVEMNFDNQRKKTRYKFENLPLKDVVALIKRPLFRDVPLQKT